MHLMATFWRVLTDSALSTSEKVPSPSFLTSLYSTYNMRANQYNCYVEKWEYDFSVRNDYLLCIFDDSAAFYNLQFIHS